MCVEGFLESSVRQSTPAQDVTMGVSHHDANEKGFCNNSTDLKFHHVFPQIDLSNGVVW